MPGSARIATATEVAVLVDLMAEFYAESGVPMDADAARRSFETLVAEDGPGCVWLLMDGAEVAGYVVLTLGFTLEYGGRDGFIDDLFVRAPHRRKGLGRIALEAAVAESRRRDVRALHLEVARDNRVAKALYARFGFRDLQRQLLTLPLQEGREGL